jgi:hypothetical protein
MSGDERIFLSTRVSGTNAADDNYIWNTTGGKIVVESVVLGPDTSVATHASNYITTTISTAAGTLTSHGTDSATGSALTAGTAKALTLTAGVGEVAAAGTIRVQVAASGTGPAYDMQVLVVARRLRGGL